MRCRFPLFQLSFFLDYAGRLILGGESEARLRSKLDSLGYSDLPLIFPPPKYCTGPSFFLPSSPLLSRPSLTLHSHSPFADNAAMIAHVGLMRLQEGKVDGLDVMQKSKWSVEECEADFEKTTEREAEL